MVQRAVVGNLFTIGACGLFVIALANFFGRLPVTFLFQSVMVGTCVWSAAATTFDSYLAARIINGFFCSVGQGGALMWVQDLFFFHEHPKVINYIEFSIILSPYLGPLITSFVVSGTSWPWAFWLCTILAGIGWILVFFLDETLFDRDGPSIPRGSYPSRLFGVQQAKGWKQRSLIRSFERPLIAVTKVPVVTILVYYFLNFAWVIGVNTTAAIWLQENYGFTSQGLGRSAWSNSFHAGQSSSVSEANMSRVLLLLRHCRSSLRLVCWALPPRCSRSLLHAEARRTS